MDKAQIEGLLSLPISELDQIPLESPPPGVEANLQETLKNTPTVIATSIFAGLAIIFFMNRICTKTFLARRITWDDCRLLRSYCSRLG